MKLKPRNEVLGEAYLSIINLLFILLIDVRPSVAKYNYQEIVSIII